MHHNRTNFDYGTVNRRARRAHEAHLRCVYNSDAYHATWLKFTHHNLRSIERRARTMVDPSATRHPLDTHSTAQPHSNRAPHERPSTDSLPPDRCTRA